MVKKLLLFISGAILMLCFIVQPADAMKRLAEEEDERRSVRMRIEPPPSFSTLPNELHFIILDLLLHNDFRSHASLPYVCKLWNTYTREFLRERGMVEDLTNTIVEYYTDQGHYINVKVTPKNPEKLTNVRALTLLNTTGMFSASKYNIGSNADRTLDPCLTQLVILRHKANPNTSKPIVEVPHLAEGELEKLTNLTELTLQYRWDTWPRLIDSKLLPLTNLTSLSLGDVYFISDTSLQNLTNLTNLALCEISVPSCPSLTNVELITDNSLQKLTNLTRLHVSYATKVTSASLSRLTNLTDLAMPPEVKNTGIERLTKLRRLNLENNVHIANKTVACFTNLTDLSIGLNVRIKTCLKDLSNLTFLSLGNRKENKIMDDHISCLPNLIDLNLGCNKYVTDNGIKKLTNLTKLVPNKNITWEGVAKLIKLRSYSSAYKNLGFPYMQQNWEKAQNAVLAGQQATNRDSAVHSFQCAYNLLSSMLYYWPDEQQIENREQFNKINALKIWLGNVLILHNHNVIQ